MDSMELTELTKPTDPALVRTAFVSDGTGITAETLGHSLLTQFEGVRIRQVRMPFVNSVEKHANALRGFRKRHAMTA